MIKLKTNRQLNEINLLRAIACIAVVLTHSITDYIRTYDPSLFGQEQFITYFRFTLLWATPVFVMISEVLISKNYPDGVRKGFLLKRVKYIMIPYILIGLIRSYMHSEGEWSVFFQRAWETVVLGHWHGFFVLVIFQFYILHILLWRFLKKTHPLPPILISFILSFTYLYVHAGNKDFRIFIDQVYPFWDRTLFIGWLFYFVVAFYIGRDYEKVINFFAKHFYIPVIGVIVSYLMIMNKVMNRVFVSVKSDRYDMLIFALSVFIIALVLLRMIKNPNQTLIKLSHFSFFIYLTHQLTLPYLSQLTQTVANDVWSHIIILTFLGVATSIGWAMLFYESRLTKPFTGRIKILDQPVK
ncbi:acyltransferase family protein [Bhargavaea massiliensis]|uniref:acyltransferase family protein n=1 Tax=Bhargavaea massiliensis TaxID=2697500 RepID=UPI001BCA8C0E|nr:acyltransferase family protein [Bhargavaea massiliensis]